MIESIKCEPFDGCEGGEVIIDSHCPDRIRLIGYWPMSDIQRLKDFLDLKFIPDDAIRTAKR